MGVARLKQFIEEGRLIRKAWTGTDAEGRETACLLSALSEDVAKAESASACPAELMPSWLAHLTPWIDDAGSDEAWPEVIRKYADIASRGRESDTGDAALVPGPSASQRRRAK